MKRIIYITISVLLVLGFGFYGLYRFSNPDWDYGYEVEDYNYLDEFLYHYDEDNFYLRGTLWMKFASYGSNNFHLYPLNSDLDIQLPLIKKEFVEVKVGELNGESYPLFLSLEFRQEEKNVFDELLCSYIKGDFCKRDLKLDSWRVYENVYPFAELTKTESIELYNKYLDYFETQVLTDREVPFDVKMWKGINTFEDVNKIGADTELDRFAYLSLAQRSSEVHREVKEAFCDSDYESLWSRMFYEKDRGYVEALCEYSSDVEFRNGDSIVFQLLRAARDEEILGSLIGEGSLFMGLNKDWCESSSSESYCDDINFVFYRILLLKYTDNEESI